MSLNPRTASQVAIAVVAALSQAAAIAAENPPGSAEAGRTSGALEEVVVTAQKREARLIDVPTAITALTASDLLDENKTRLQDYFRDVPGLVVTSSGSGTATLAIRGVSTGNTTNPTVGVTIDDVPYGSVSGLGFGSIISPPDLDPTDLQRIEVLRGPQGTLYGASSLGGLLQFVTADPSFKGMAGRVEVGGNSIASGGSGWDGRGAINLPLSDTVAMRASAFVRHDGGFINDPVHGFKNLDRSRAEGGHLGLLWNIGSRATLKLSALYQESYADGASQIDTDSSLKPTLGDLAQNHLLGTGLSANRVQLYSANLSVDLGDGMKFVSVSGFARNGWITLTDFTPAFGVYLAPDGAAVYYNFWNNRFSQELRLQQSTGSVDWVVGAFYSHEASGDFITLDDVNQATGALVTNSLLIENDEFRFKEYAGFGSATLHITKEFSLEGGVRYSHNNQFYKTDLVGPFSGSPTGEYLFSQPSSDHSLTYSLTPSYKITDNVLGYVRIASGYRPGGPNAGVFGVGTPITYLADKTTNYEIGIKGEAFERRLSFEASAYYVNWKDIQLGSVDPVTNFLYFQNARTAKSKGIELSASAIPWTDARLGASVAVNRAELSADLPATAAFGHPGDPLPNAPHLAASLNFEQDFRVSELVTAFAGASVNYVDSRVGAFVNTAAEVRAQMPSYTLAGVRGGIRTTTGWTVNAYVSNIGNERGVLLAGSRAGTSFPTDPFSKTVVQPRTIGVSVAKSF
jgi:iron complex outermembrane receptor protein